LKRLKETTDELLPAGSRIIKVIPDLSRESVRQLIERIGIQAGDILYVKTLASWGRGIVHEIAKTGVEAVIVNEKVADTISTELRDAFFHENLPLLISKEMHINIKGEIGTCNEERYDDACEEWREEHEKFLKGKGEEMLESLMKEYLAERERRGK
jgi:predicted RNase H-like nuclease (RuvC/YqgF family)